MKASLGVVLVLAGTCVAGRAAGQAVVVGPRAGSMAMLPGAQVTVPIVADLSNSGGASLGSITARLLWHPSILAYRGISAGVLGTPVVNADSAGGSLRFALANPGGATGQPILVNAIFSVVGTAGAADTLKVNLQELTRAVTFADLLPIGTTTSAMMCVSTGVLGDLDGSGTITSHDALVIVTNAVGLPITPYTTINGDVDGDGRVDTRDALIVLSYVVGLPIPSFRVAQLNGGLCAVPSPASVQIQPTGATVVTGDRVPLSATVRDSSGAVVSGIGLVWTSADTTVVKADATGNLVGVGAGTARVYANASPGLKDSITVTVSAARHVWYVNPAIAARNAGVELGSSAYPFSSILPAVTRAAAFDSVFVAPAVYGEGVHLTRPIFVFGDSTAAGRTIIRNPTGAAILVDGLTSGGVLLDRLWLEDSFGGLVARGSGTGVVQLRRITVARSRSAGISVGRVAAALLDHVRVLGAVDRGIELDTVSVVRFRAVIADQVSRDTAAAGDVHAVHVLAADSLSADSLVVGTANVLVDRVRTVSLVRVEASHAGVSPDNSEYVGPIAVDVNAADSLRVDSSAFHDNAFGALICRSCRAVYVARSSFVHNLLSGGDNIVLDGPSRATLYGLTVTGDSGIGGGLWLRLWGLGSRTVVDSSVFTGAPSLVYADQHVSGELGDTLVISRSLLRSSGTGVWASALSSFTLSGSTIDSAANGVTWLSPGLATVYGNTFSHVGAVAVQATSGTVAIDSNAIGPCRNDGFASGIYLSPASGVITRNSITGCRYGVYSAGGSIPQQLRIGRNTIVRDAVHVGTGLFVSDAYDSVAIFGNIIQRGLGSGIEMVGSSSGIASARVDSNTVQGILGYGMSFSGTISAVSMTFNTLADNDVGLYSWVPVQGTLNTVARNVSSGVTIYASVPTTFRRANFVGNGHFALFNGNLGPPPVVADSSFWGDPSGPQCTEVCYPLATGDSIGYPGVDFRPPPLEALVAGAPPIPDPLPAGAPPVRGAPQVPTAPPRPLVSPVARPSPANRLRTAGVRP